MKWKYKRLNKSRERAFDFTNQPQCYQQPRSNIPAIEQSYFLQRRITLGNKTVTYIEHQKEYNKSVFEKWKSINELFLESSCRAMKQWRRQTKEERTNNKCEQNKGKRENRLWSILKRKKRLLIIFFFYILKIQMRRMWHLQGLRTSETRIIRTFIRLKKIYE